MPLSQFDKSLIAGVQDDLAATWQKVLPTFEKQQEPLLRKVKYTKIRNPQYVWKESLPFPALWPYGAGRKYKTLKDRSITLSKTNFELTIPWSKFDEDDDQIGDMKPHIMSCVKRYAALPMVLATEYFNGVAVENPALTLAYDGAGLFSDVDGNGADRMGVSGGNILTGSGATVAGVIHDAARVQQRLLSMKDPTAGKPIFDESTASYNNMVAIIPPALNEVFQKATGAELIRISNDNNVSESNFLKGTFSYMQNPYLTDTSDWYMVLNNDFWKPFVFIAPEDIQTVLADVNNSDRAREFNENIIYTHIRTSLGLFFPGCIIKINN